MDLVLAEGDSDAPDGAFAVGADAEGDEDCAVDKMAAVRDLFAAGSEDNVGGWAERALAPGGEGGVEFCGAVIDLGRADGRPAEVLDDGGDFACGDAPDVHLSEGGLEGLFAADAFLE